MYLIQLSYKHYIPTNLLATNNHPKCLHFSIFILTQLTTLFFRDASFPGVYNIFLLVLFLTVVTVPDTWLGHSEHLLNAESKHHFPLSNQYSIVFFKDFYFSKYLLHVYILYFPSFACYFSHVYFLIQIHSFNCYQYSDDSHDTGVSYL